MDISLGVTEVMRGGFKVIEVDTEKARYKGKSWHSLSDFYKRKWENMHVLMRPKERIKFNYR